MLNFCNKAIEYSFYSLFFFVPFAMTSNTFELFEFNKMWLTYGFTLIVACFWFTKMALQKKFSIQRTPLDIPILLFLISQIISTIFSWDTHISIWGYYSRFNGGLLSIFSYIFLYYAFVSNLSNLLIVKRLIIISLISGLFVALWGLPSHFGYDPTCYMFRGSLDVSCWTDAFQPKIRIFSTLGQPDWLAAYLAILIPIAVAYFINNSKSEARNPKQYQISKKNLILATCYLLLAILFYLNLTYTRARSGFLGIWGALFIFILGYFWSKNPFAYLPKNKKIPLKPFFKNSLINNKYLFIVLSSFLLISFFIGNPIFQLQKTTFQNLANSFSKPKEPKPAGTDKKTETQKLLVKKEAGGTESGTIRMYVWEGALNAWKANPLFGTGVETFAFAYYKYKPAGHNLTSEWDYLYNKAHNEYLNYLATTGSIGLGSYLLMIGMFLFLAIKGISNVKFQISNLKSESLEIGNLKLVIIGIIAGYISILVTNFFGFSVVVTSLYFYLIPAFIFILQGTINPNKLLIFSKNASENKDVSQDKKGHPQQQHAKKINEKTSSGQWILITILFSITLYFLLNLIKFWQADVAYSSGYNLDKTNQFIEANSKLQEAIEKRGDEPVFKDEFFLNNSILGTVYANQKDIKTSDLLIQQAIALSDNLLSEYPNNVVFWKTRVRGFYTLGQMDKKYLPLALESIKKANELAPTDAKISYNLGLLYAQNGDFQKATKTLETTAKLKPDYFDAYYALALYYHETAVDKSGRIKDFTAQKKAIDTLNYISTHLSPDNGKVKELLNTWNNQY